MKIKILVDNYVTQRDFLAEHGFSIFIEDEGEKILFDTGQGMALLHNMNLTGLALKDIDEIILSHGHDDHTGGLKFFVESEIYPGLIAHPDVVYPKYKIQGEKKKNIGINVPIDKFKKILTKDALQVSKHILFSGEVPKENRWELEETAYFREKGGVLEKDPFVDDISLFVPLKEGLLIITGCAHSGIINIINYGFEVTRTKKLYGIIGGMHLKDASYERIEKTIKLMLELDPEFLTISHCTGPIAGSLFREKLGKKVIFTDAGWEFNVE